MEPAPNLDDPAVWTHLVEAANPASLLVAIGSRMGAELRARLSEEDIWQEALMKAWSARRSFTWADTPSFRRWLLRIAENCIGDHRDYELAGKRDMRRNGSLALRSGSSSDDGTSGASFEPWGSTTPSRIASEKERAEKMRAALDRLPEELREVVRLRLFEDLLLEEIAVRLDLGISAVRHRFRKGSELYQRLLRD
ncbi:MAG: sigma-70 family RNA polymerase sigma factor [Planctomycetes bacterium]|nr:sigma-70 family RNA polymerase sigma factor [Planctomycetota bacterium]